MAYLRSELAQNELVDDLEQRTAEHFNQFRQEIHETTARKDSFEQRFVEPTNQLGNFTDKERFADLTKRLDKFAEQVRSYTVKTKTSEADFKEHVDVAFGIVDQECKKLKDFITDVEHESKQGKSRAVEQ